MFKICLAWIFVTLVTGGTPVAAQESAADIADIKRRLNQPLPAAPPERPAQRASGRIFAQQHATLCTSPFRLREASAAVQSGDVKWLRSLDCASLSERTEVIFIDKTSDWIKARIRLPDQDGVTVYGLPTVFEDENGKSNW